MRWAIAATKRAWFGLNPESRKSRAHTQKGDFVLGTPRQAFDCVMAVARPGMVAWDVGAHVGFYTLLFAELVGRRGKVYAFEPAPANVELLRRHMEMNAYGKVSILRRPNLCGDRRAARG